MRRYLFALLLLPAALAPAAGSVRAATTRSTLTVQNCNATDPGSLASAMAQAQAGDIIEFALDCSGANRIMVSSMLAPGVSPLTIDAGTHHVVLDGGGSTSLFHVLPGNTLTLRHLTLQNAGGSTAAPAPGFSAGAIFDEGTLTVQGAAFQNNDAHTTKTNTGRGAAIYAYGGQAGALTVTDTYFTNNNNAEGVIDELNGQATISSSTFDSNGTAPSPNAWVVRANGGTFTNDTFVNNSDVVTTFELSNPITLTASTIDSENDGQVFDTQGQFEIAVGSTIFDTNGDFCGEQITSLGYNVYNPAGPLPTSCGYDPSKGDILASGSQIALEHGVSNHGGAVPTDAIAANSVAVDIVPQGSLCPATDPRGYPRPDENESKCDAGAFETGALPTAALVRRVQISHHPTITTIRWTMARQRGVLGFDLLASGRRLNAHLIGAHASPRYAVRVPWNGRGRLTLTVVLTNGRRSLVRLR